MKKSILVILTFSLFCQLAPVEAFSLSSAESFANIRLSKPLNSPDLRTPLKTPLFSPQSNSTNPAEQENVPKDSWYYSKEYTAPDENFLFETNLRIDEQATQRLPIEQDLKGMDYNNQENIGGYEAALVMRQSGTNDRYRAMFSSTWKEILIWSSRGGILAVKPFAFDPGVTYKVSFAKHGNRLLVAVNDKTIVSLIDRTTPIKVDRYGLATKEGIVWFSRIKSKTLTGSISRLDTSVHVANFSLRTWKGVTWGFDGDEPIFALPNRTAFASEVKLVPGYAAQMALQWYIQNWVDEAFRTDIVTNIEEHEKGTKLSFTITSKDETNRTDLINKTKVTVSYDEAKNVYVYDHVSELIVPAGSNLRMSYPLDIADPVFLQSVPSGSTYGRQWPVTHQWGAYQHPDGNYYKQPFNHADWYPGYGTQEFWNKGMHKMKADGGSWALVGDRIANPVLQWNESPTRNEFSALVCWFAYDLHFNWMPGDGSPVTLPSGTYTFKWSVSSLPGDEADARLSSAKYAVEGDMSLKWLLYTGGVGHVEKFDKTALRASPFGEYIWGDSAYQDTAVGYDDTTSLRLEGPDFVKTSAGDSMFTESFLPDTDYEISAWIKTENVQGKGPGIIFSGQPYYPGITGTTDWQQIGFVARPQEPLYSVPFFLHNAGSGKVWFDNFQIRPITAVNPVALNLNNRPRPIAKGIAIDPNAYLILDPKNALTDAARTVLDGSNRQNNGVLQNATVETVAENKIFRFRGNDAQVLMRGHESTDFSAPATLVTWIKPGTGVNGWNVVASGGIDRADYWRIILSKVDDYRLAVHTPGGTIDGSGTIVPEGVWSQLALVDDGTTASFYFNDTLVGTTPSNGNIFGKGPTGYVRLGAMSYEGRPTSGVEGDVSALTIFTKAWSAEEIKASYLKGPFGL